MSHLVNPYITCFAGSYVGNGGASLAITGVGFKANFLKIWAKETVDDTTTPVFETTQIINTNNVSGGCVTHKANGTVQFDTGKIRSIDNDGFTVGDNGINENPNKSGSVYDFIALP